MKGTKMLLFVIDGLGDRPDARAQTPLSLAKKPAIDSLARRGRVGLLDIGYEKGVVNSDFGFLNILGCHSKNDYPGRGYLEALGLGLEPGPGELCIRGNFATLDQQGNIVDRRAGRDEAGLKQFCERLDGMEIDGVEFTIRKSAGHRVVLVLKPGDGTELSDAVVPNDPLKEGVPLPQITAKKSDARARFTASVLNKFIYRSNKILAAEPANRKREKPANIILIRNLGRKKETESFKERFGLSACCVAGIPIARGVARFLGMDVIDVKGATGMPDTNLKAKARAVEDALKRYDFVWLHVNGADILSHDRKRKQKTEFIEKIDDMIVTKINGAVPGLFWIITCDHRTVSLPESEWKGYRHVPDPVPLLVSGGKGTRIKAEGRGFSEKECEEARMRFEGNDLLLMMLRGL